MTTAAAFLLLSVTTTSFLIANSHLCGLRHSNQEKSQPVEDVFMYTRLVRQSMRACFAFFSLLFTIFPHLFVFPSFWKMVTVTSAGVDEECCPVFKTWLTEALINLCRQGSAGEVAHHERRVSAPACRQRGCQANADRSFPIHVGEGKGGGNRGGAADSAARDSHDDDRYRCAQ